MFVLWILLLICPFTGVASLTSTEWRQQIPHQYYEWTRAFDEHDLDAFMDMYSEDCIEMKPGEPVFNKEGIREDKRESFKKFRFTYIGFVDLLFSTDTVALARHVGFGVTQDGKEETFHGVRMFVTEGNEIKIKINIYN